MNQNGRFQILSEFPLRILALIAMTLDHIGVFLGYSNQVGFIFRCIGRIAFPIFALLLAEGFRYTRSREKYLLRIAVMWASITAVEAVLNYGFPNLIGTAPANPFTDLLMCLLFLYFIESKSWRKIFAIFPLAWIGVSFGCALYSSMVDWSVTIHWFPLFLWSSYSILGLVIVLGFYYAPKLVEALFKKNPAATRMSVEAFRETPQYRGLVNTIGAAVLFVITVIFWGISYIGRTDTLIPYDPYYMTVQSYAIVAILFLYMYNGKRGYDSKPFRVFSYLYFPVHIILIAAFFLLH